MAKRNPKLTRNGKTRLKPLSLAQLQALEESSSRKKEKGKIRNRIKVLLSQQ